MNNTDNQTGLSIVLPAHPFYVEIFQCEIRFLNIKSSVSHQGNAKHKFKRENKERKRKETKQIRDSSAL